MAYTAIDDSGLYFNTKLYTGNASTQSITGVGFQPDLIWIKCRGATENHTVVDSVRGDSDANTGYFYISTNSTDADSSGSGNTLVDAITSDGFNIGNNDQVNIAQPFASWNWKAGTTSGITTNGSTTITPSAYSFNQTAGFSTLAYTGNQTSGAKLAHGLGVKPDMIITKSRAGASGWGVYHKSLGATYGMLLNTTAAKDDDATAWNDVEPDTVNITLGSSINTNKTGTCVGYAFAEKQGYSKFGSYTGNGNTANNTFVYTGFKVGWVLIKRSSSSGEGWFIFDSTRSPANLNVNELRADTTAAETTGSHWIDFLSNGFKPKTNGAGIGGSGDTYIYMAFAEAPFVTSTGVPATAR